MQWLTSDGVSNTSYNGSAAYNIITDIKTGSTAKKRYQNTGLTNADPTRMEERLYSNMTTFLNASTSQDPYNSEDFPVLVVNDISTANEAVNHYLKLLTNTSYDFSKGYPGTATYDEQNIFNVDISRWLYNNTTGKFEKLTLEGYELISNSKNIVLQTAKIPFAEEMKRRKRELGNF